MNTKILHLLCSTKKALKKAEKAINSSDCIIQKWKTQNTKSHSIYLMINDSDQDLFDRLQKIAKKEEKIRLMVLPIEATFPKTKEEKKEEKKENNPAFFTILSREEICEEANKTAQLNGSYLILTILSAIVATIALIKGNTAVLIGAMVLTPLLGVNISLAFATAIANLPLIKKSLTTNLCGIFLAFLASVITGYTIGKHVDSEISKIIVEYGFEAIAIAACAGVSATILMLQGTLSSIIGVMVAVAFLPPLALTGLSISNGEYQQALDAGLLFAINLATFNLSAKIVFFLSGIRPLTKEKGIFPIIIRYILAWGLIVVLLGIALYFK